MLLVCIENDFVKKYTSKEVNNGFLVPKRKITQRSMFSK